MQITFETDHEHSHHWEGDNGSYTKAYRCPLNPTGIYVRDVDCTPGFGEIDEGFRSNTPCLKKSCHCISDCHIGVVPIIECEDPCNTAGGDVYESTKN